MRMSLTYRNHFVCYDQRILNLSNKYLLGVWLSVLPCQRYNCLLANYSILVRAILYKPFGFYCSKGLHILQDNHKHERTLLFPI